MFIVFEGGSGGGKGTQIQLLAEALRQRGYQTEIVSILDSTEVGRGVREITSKVPHGQLGHLNEALLFLAAIGHAMPLILQVPKGAIRIADRFVWSTIAYQGYGGGVPLDFLKDLAATVIGNIWPDLTIYLDIPPLEGLARHTDTGQTHFVQPDFRSMVRNGYLTMAKQSNWLVINANQPAEKMHEEVLQKVLSLLS